MTDPNVAKLKPMQTVRVPPILHGLKLTSWHQALAALEAEGDLKYEVYDRVVAEPTEDSWRDAITWAREHDFSHFLAWVIRERVMNSTNR
jgi:hydroxyacid-oxoacid transhydrogenase